MFKGKTIEVCVKDHADRSEHVHLGINRTIAQVRPQILEKLAVALEYNSGEPITYTLYNESEENNPHLEGGQSVADVITAGQTIRAVPDITAGGKR